MTNKRYTDEEIKKALANCAFSAYNPDACTECHYNNVGAPTCVASCTNDALILIYRQESKIERLKKEVSVARDAYISIQDRYEHTKAEAYKEVTEKLKEAFLNLQYNAETHRKTVKIEELKEQMDWLLHTVAIETVENLLKETVGEEK